MGEVIDYVIIDSPTTEELVDQVGSMIEAGFEPLGGVAVEAYAWSDGDRGDEHIAYLQAMVKRTV